ncbi:hypothetical protein [Tateyamaria sp. SN6-1]|uniref:hypothetical protein n=1 Tax=Tateyamaria sp. SN6-1 TaxID=3092148 RepID=UPI0039F51565
MMSNNKILTVSYGTFSCTLEGFDDSFGTMKAIAEYFRDLASDDRYFGAEPPVPDAEMLARIAEREISRRVEAREQEGRIVLSAEPDAAAPAVAPAAIAAAAPVVAPAPALAEAAAEDAAPVDAEEPAVVAEESVAEAPEVAEPAPEYVSVDEAEPQEAVAEVIEETVDDADAKAAPDMGDDAPGADAAEVDLDALMASVEAQDDDETPEPVAEAETAEAFFADSEDAQPEAEAEVEAEETGAEADVVEAEAPVAADSIAAKLQRIRAVVSQSQDAAEKDEMFEDEHAEPFTTKAASDETPEIADIVAPQDDASDADVLADVVADIEDIAEDESVEDTGGDDIADILARYDTAPEDDAAPEEDAATEEDASHDDAEALEDAPSQDAETDTPDIMGADSLADDLDVDLHGDDSADNLFDEADAPETDAAEPAAPRRARIIKVKRADIDAAIAQGQIEEVVEPEDTQPASSLSASEEAELQAELDAVAAELPGADAVESEAEEAPEAITDEATAEEQAPVNDDDVSRLMAEVDNQMEEPEGSSRRNAFQHLKAAVMAKKADQGLGDDAEKDEGAFRSDLASVVIPRRPAAPTTARGERPSAERPAPLKLVAEQRVDVESAKPSGPVRPRRVAQADEPQAADPMEGGFADYASEMGAHSLPDLLEAAASYLSFVEGHDQFSRPQLMTKVRQVEKEDFSREDGLRSFGQLLRAGKIEKRKGGRFTVTGDIGYRPDERAAG